MKKFYILISLLLITFFSFGQQVDRNWVLVEIGTGCWCYYCPGAALGADDLIQNGAPAAIIENHNGDPFATTDSDARNSYYGITGYPTAWFDGSYDEVIGGSHTESMYSTYQPIVNSRILDASDFTLDIYGTNSGDDYDLTIRLQEVESYSGDNIKLRFALTESDIQYSWQGQSEVNFVNHLMLPDNNGTDLSGYDLTQLTDIELSFTFDNSWDSQNCELVAFLQDDDTKEVLQSQKVALNALIPVLAADFVASDTLTCTGSTVDFTDLSEGQDIQSWSWTFEGGTPSVSTDQNPSVTYNSTGSFDVELTVTDANGADTKTVENYINVLETPGQTDAPLGENVVCNGMPVTYTTNEVDFAQDYEWELSPSAAGNLIADGTEAELDPTTDWTGDFTIRVRATNICGDGEWSDYLEGTLLDSPNEFTLEGGGGYCMDSDGSEITLSGSETTASYELYLNGDPTGIIVEGTGSALSFGLQTDEGYYTAIGYNDDCSTMMIEQVEVYMMFAPVEPGIPAGNTAICNNDTTSYTTTGSEDAEDYNWYIDPSDAGTITADGMNATIDWNEDYAGTASLTVTGVNACGEGGASDELVIDVDDIPEPSVTGETEVCDNQAVVYSTLNTEGNTYSWTIGGGTITDGTGTSEITVQWGEPGTGSISVEEETPNGCWAQSDVVDITIDNCTGINEHNNMMAFSFYPNPAHEKLTILLANKNSLDGRLYVMNQVGQTVIEVPVDTRNGSTEFSIDISQLQKGVYLIKFTDTDDHTLIKKFVKE